VVPRQTHRAGQKKRSGNVFADEIMAFYWHGETFDIPRGGQHILPQVKPATIKHLVTKIVFSRFNTI